jgi:hypothetical protein
MRSQYKGVLIKEDIRERFISLWLNTRLTSWFVTLQNQQFVKLLFLGCSENFNIFLLSYYLR